MEHIFKLYCLPFYETCRLLKQSPCFPNSETSSLCSWIHTVCARPLHLWVLLFCTFFSRVGFPFSRWIASCLPGCATALCYTMMAVNNDQYKGARTQTHTNRHQCLEARPISRRICSLVIMDNNTTLGTNCYTITRPAVKLPDTAVCSASGKIKSRPVIC